MNSGIGLLLLAAFTGIGGSDFEGCEAQSFQHSDYHWVDGIGFAIGFLLDV
jgi:hypothetical protein